MPHRILIVDSDAAARESTAAYLKLLGYCVDASPDARAALAAALAATPDLAVLGANAGEDSGVEAYMRLNSICPDMQAVFLVADAAIADTDRDFLRYSIPPERLIAPSNGDFAPLIRIIIGALGPPSV